MKVKVLRPFLHAGVIRKKDEVVDLRDSVAAEVVLNNRAAYVPATPAGEEFPGGDAAKKADDEAKKK